VTSREEQLGRRVRWLDRYRRSIAVTCALVFGPYCFVEMGRLLGSQWPEAHLWLLTICASMITWWVVEVALAWQTAVWETQYDRLRGERGLPAARVVRR
jgi:hypothetical protein